jgi:hypothetical protein
MKSLNQLYKESGSTAKFKDWVSKGQDIFNQQKAKGMLPEATPFEWWAEEVGKYNCIGADGGKLNITDPLTPPTASSGTTTATAPKVDWAALFNNAKDIWTAAAPLINKPSTSSAVTPTPSGSYTPPKSTTILGMKPGVFVAVSGVFVLLVGVGIYAIVKSSKK